MVSQVLIMSGNPFVTNEAAVRLARTEMTSGVYQYCARRMFDGSRLLSETVRTTNGPILVLGFGFGGSIAEILSRNSRARMMGIDSSGPLVNLAVQRFGIRKKIDSDIDADLAEFLRKEAQVYEGTLSNLKDPARIGRLILYNLDAMNLDGLLHSMYNYVVNFTKFELVPLNHFWHWTIKQGIEEKVLAGLRNVMEQGGLLAFNTSASFMAPDHTDMRDVSIFYHGLMRAYFEKLTLEARKHGVGITLPFEKADSFEPPNKLMERGPKIEQFGEAGFEFIEYYECLIPIVRNEHGELDAKGVADLIREQRMAGLTHELGLLGNLPDETKGIVIEAARAAAIAEAGESFDNDAHGFDVNPVFVFRRA